MDLVKVYTCPCCLDKVFSSSSSLSQHKKSKKHKMWEEKTKVQKIEETRKENEIFANKLKLKDRDEMIEKLILEKGDLQNEINVLKEKVKMVVEHERTIYILVNKLEKIRKK